MVLVFGVLGGLFGEREEGEGGFGVVLGREEEERRREEGEEGGEVVLGGLSFFFWGKGEGRRR